MFLSIFFIGFRNCYDNWIIFIFHFLSMILLFLTFRTVPTFGYFFVFHFISTICLLNVGTVPIVWYLFFILLLSYFSVLDNTMWYDRSFGQRVDVGILGVVTVQSAVDCARRCHQHINCNNFNFRRINMKCELVGARKTDSKPNINYDVYSQC